MTAASWRISDRSSVGAAGQRNEYASANTIVMSLILEAVSGQSFADFVRDRLWAPMGAEADALVAISPEGFAYTSGGVALRLRDLARFGELHTRPEGFGVLSAAMLADIQGNRGIPLEPGRAEQRAAYFFGDPPLRASWQWDHVWSDGALYKGGYSGQGLYVDPDRDLVLRGSAPARTTVPGAMICSRSRGSLRQAAGSKG